VQCFRFLLLLLFGFGPLLSIINFGPRESSWMLKGLCLHIALLRPVAAQSALQLSPHIHPLIHKHIYTPSDASVSVHHARQAIASLSGAFRCRCSVLLRDTSTLSKEEEEAGNRTSNLPVPGCHRTHAPISPEIHLVVTKGLGGKGVGSRM